MSNPPPPRTYAERGFNIQRWTQMPTGGHFFASEEPKLLAQDLREFFRPLR
jgi:pimeloyl-ACP methyl ester carboxylesterase